MKKISKIWISTAFFVLTAFLFSTALVESIDAAPTVRPNAGRTSVQLSGAFVNTLIALEIAPGALDPGGRRSR